MVVRKNITKVLVIGAGPVVIGHGDEYDSYGAQACRTLRDLNYKVVVVNSNPATVMTRSDLADATYVEPLSTETLKKIISRERPDAILPTVGGTSAFTLCLNLSKAGILNEFNIELLGTSIKAICQCEGHQGLRENLANVGIDILRGKNIHSVEEAEATAAELGYPVAVYTSFLPGRRGSGIAYNIEEMRDIAGRAIAASLQENIFIEEVKEKLEKFEIQVMRDSKNRMITVSTGEFIDGAGIHEGDSLCTIPAITPSQPVKAKIKNVAYKIMENLGVTGAASVLFCYDNNTGVIYVHSITPACSRSAAFISLATGFPIVEVSTKLACGVGLDEIDLNEKTKLEYYVPGEDYVAVRLPRWDFASLPGAWDRLGPQMRSTGEVVGLGKNYKEAMQKAVRSRGDDTINLIKSIREKPASELITMLNYPSSTRMYVIYDALRRGVGVPELSEKTGINPWFIQQMSEIIETEASILEHQGKELPEGILVKAKKDGFSDKFLAETSGTSEEAIRERRYKTGIIPKTEYTNKIKGNSPYYYLTYSSPGADNAIEKEHEKILALGGGPHGIGVGSEVDCGCSEAVDALAKTSYKVNFIDCCPASTTLIHNLADKSYIAPLTAEDIFDVCQSDNIHKVIPQFGGYRVFPVLSELEETAINVLGVAKSTVNSIINKETYKTLMEKLGIPVQDCTEKGIAFEVCCLSDGKDVFIPAIIGHIEYASVHSGDAAAVVPASNVSHKNMSIMREYAGRIVHELKIAGLLNIEFMVCDNIVYISEVIPFALRNVPLLTKITGISLASCASEIITGKTLKELPLANKIGSFVAVKESVFPFDMFPEIDPVLGPQMKSTGEVLGIASSFGLAFGKAQEAINPLPVDGAVLITVASQDREGAADIAARFASLGFKIRATSGTQAFLTEKGIQADHILKEYEGRPNITDAIKNKEIQLVINTPEDKQSKYDDSYIRKAAIKYKVPYITTITGAVAAIAGIEAFRDSGYEVRSLQEYSGY